MYSTNTYTLIVKLLVGRYKKKLLKQFYRRLYNWIFYERLGRAIRGQRRSVPSVSSVASTDHRKNCSGATECLTRHWLGVAQNATRAASANRSAISGEEPMIVDHNTIDNCLSTYPHAF